MTTTPSTGLSVQQVQEMVRRELSTPARVGYLLAMMGTLLAAGLIGTLWLTEPGQLPLRTQCAFGGLVSINLAWSGLFAWIVTSRKVLFAAHRVIAGGMAVAFCGMFLVFGLAIALAKANGVAVAAVVVVGGAQLVVAIEILRRAIRRRQQLWARSNELAGMLSERRRQR